MSIKLASNLEPEINAPLDARCVVWSVRERNAIRTSYEGMRVYVKETESFHYYDRDGWHDERKETEKAVEAAKRYVDEAAEEALCAAKEYADSLALSGGLDNMTATDEEVEEMLEEVFG